MKIRKRISKLESRIAELEKIIKKDAIIFTDASDGAVQVVLRLANGKLETIQKISANPTTVVLEYIDLEQTN